MAEPTPTPTPAPTDRDALACALGTLLLDIAALRLAARRLDRNLDIARARGLEA